jgi:hypothetical protein
MELIYQIIVKIYSNLQVKFFRLANQDQRVIKRQLQLP